MWTSMFAIVLAIALGLGVGAWVLESYEEASHRRHRPLRGFRAMRMRIRN
jgi:predicted RND superfamily exporter protein